MVDCKLKNTTVSPQRIYYVEENLHKLYIKWKMNSYVVMSVCKSVIKPLRWYFAAKIGLNIMETKGIYPKHTSLERLSIESKVNLGLPSL